jgi:hypothetical protein
MTSSDPLSGQLGGLPGIDREQLFRDCGTLILVRVITAAYSPATGLRTESATDMPVQAVVGGLTRQPSRGTAGQHFERHETFSVRNRDWPPEATVGAGRIVHAGRVLAIVQIDASPDGGLLTVVAQQI